MAEAAATQTIVQQIMNNPIVVIIGAILGYGVTKIQGNKRQNQMPL
jgi:hypothetical protein